MKFRIEQAGEYGRWRITDGAEEKFFDADFDRDGRASLILQASMMLGSGEDILSQIDQYASELADGAASAGPSVESLRAEARRIARLADHPDGSIDTDGDGEVARLEPVLIRACDVEPEPVQYVWDNRIPKGKITLLAGRQGEGKSLFALTTGAYVSRGMTYPDGAAACEAGGVLICTPEDGVADTIIGRLIAAGADRRRINILTGSRLVTKSSTREMFFTLADLPVLEAAFQQTPDLRLVILDPVGSLLGGEIKTDKDNAVRSVLAPLAQLAEKYNVAVLLVAHTRKAGADYADDLVMGSRAFAAPGAVWHLSADPDNAERRLLLPGKNNLGRRGAGLAFTIEGNPPKIWFEPEPVALSADEAMRLARDRASGPGRPAEARDSAEAWLRRLLAGGSVKAADIQIEARAAGIVWRTVQRAAENLKIERRKLNFGAGWVWSLAAEDATKMPRLPVSMNSVMLSPSVEIKKYDVFTHPPREDDNMYAHGGNVSPSGMRTDDRDYSSGDPDGEVGP